MNDRVVARDGLARRRLVRDAALRAAAAAVALWLAADQARVWWAEQAYEAGIRARDPSTGKARIDDPTAEVPGRLHAYREASLRDPREPLYALRAAQLEFRDVRRPADDATREALLGRVQTALDAALDAHPLDGRTHAALANLLIARGDRDGALRHTRLSVVLGPRRPTALEQAARRFAATWPRTNDPDALVQLLETTRLGLELLDGRPAGLPPLGRVPAVGEARALLLSEGGPTRDDVLFALRGRRDLLLTAARVVEDRRPDDAAAYRAAAEAGS